MKHKTRWMHILLTIVWLSVAGISLYGGLDYYQLSLQDRAYSDLHDAWKPSGFIGHGMGIVGSLMMIVGVAMYSLRKRVKRMEHSGALRTWLSVHIFLCTLGPWLVLLHMAFRFGGIISIAFWSMVAVVLSGVFGRYIYVRIPKTANGEFLSAQALQARQRHMMHTILEYHDVDEQAILAVVPVNVRSRALLGGFSGQTSVRAAAMQLGSSRGMESSELQQFVHQVVEYTTLIQQTSLTGLLQRLFGYWHVFHLPLALIMLAIMLFHIGVAFTFGYFWIS